MKTKIICFVLLVMLFGWFLYLGCFHSKAYKFEEGYLHYSAEELDLITRVVHAEAGNEKFVGRVAVATVIFNRMDYYGKTAQEIINQPNQFTTPAKKYTDDDMRAVIFAASNRDLFPKTMLFFRNQYFFKDLGEPYIQIGNHYFSILKEDK